MLSDGSMCGAVMGHTERVSKATQGSFCSHLLSTDCVLALEVQRWMRLGSWPKGFLLSDKGDRKKQFYLIQCGKYSASKGYKYESTEVEINEWLMPT